MKKTDRPELSKKLPKKLLKRLGKDPDGSLAEEFGIPVSQVSRIRHELGIPAFEFFNWTSEAIAILGTMPDEQAAAAIGVTRNSAFRKRVVLGIPAFGKSKSETEAKWSAAQIRRLGTLPDQQLAKQLGISVYAVYAKRCSKGIPAARSIGQTRKPWRADEIKMLGKKPDTVVAKATGRGRRHVRAKRESLGIPPFQQQTSIQWTPKLIKRLGTVSNRDLAKELGVSEGTISLYRCRFGK